MNPKSFGPTWRTALTACALMAALTAICAQTPPPALLTPPAAAQSQQALAAKRIGEAIQSVNWSSTNEADARKTIEAAMEPFGMTFSYFILRERTAHIPRRMDANFGGATCLNPIAWADALGQPLRISLRGTHEIQRESSPEMIRRIISGEERRFGPIDNMLYPPMPNLSQLCFHHSQFKINNLAMATPNFTTQSPIFHRSHWLGSRQYWYGMSGRIHWNSHNYRHCL